ncbi:MAG: transcription antitermination factor NusB [Christensenellales bacterium]
MARHAARRAAMQLIYEQMMGGGDENTLHSMINFPEDDPEITYIHTVLDGVISRQDDIDGQIALRSTNRELSRIPAVVRAILRLALYELQYMPEVPQRVVINEAVELAKRYADEVDGKFVNGLLGAFVRDKHPT